MFHVKITMAVSNHPPINAFLEKVFMVFIKSIGPSPKRFVGLFFNCSADILLGLLKILIGVDPKNMRASKPIDLRRTLCPFVELGEGLCDVPQVVIIEFMPLEKGLHQSMLWDPFHFNGIFDDFPAPPSEAMTFPVESDWKHTEVDIFRQTLVERHLLMAVVFALFELCKIEKSEINRLFDFVDIVVCNEDEGNMGLNCPFN